MKSIWRVVATIVLTLVILGAVALGIGIFTGGSVERMIALVFGGMDQLLRLAGMLQRELSALVDTIISLFNTIVSIF